MGSGCLKDAKDTTKTTENNSYIPFSNEHTLSDPMLHFCLFCVYPVAFSVIHSPIYLLILKSLDLDHTDPIQLCSEHRG